MAGVSGGTWHWCSWSVLVLPQVPAPHAGFAACWVLLISAGAEGTLGGCCYRAELDVNVAFCGTKAALPAPPACMGLTVTQLMFSSSLAVACGRTVPPCSVGRWHAQGRAGCPSGVAMCLLSPFVAQCPSWHTGSRGHRESVGAHMELVQLLGEG